MEYFKMQNIDFSMYVNSLNIIREAKYNSQTNAAGDTVIDYINSKRTIEVGIIPLDDESMRSLQQVLKNTSVWVAYRDPQTQALENALCFIPSNGVEYYTIQADKVLYKAFKLKFTEL